ncbi:DUF370 domain-containing protein [Leptospira bourretii]|uniref:Putative regulatory protein EHQ23_11945 n=1 Tax=Leptospira bourretii TaxID=2484962 RepID=A0A4R9IM83_9LEPT|nr:DUF370 domain-containing protein [Leptospira bourretii]TGK85360.1 DUF370 domain-containing protein [Leptospira bourretii]TGK91120.1 DUF370 domain-containing protein [Leptospira bourretii]TGL17839.1 DUF370 domain-containing protein [Leptospira bourretii]TGL30705.1 DUF370 domain-containing protein [Leptospira bourretii]
MSSFPILNVGFSNVVFVSKILTILQADSAGAKRLRSEAKSESRLIDATGGRKTRSVLVLDSGHILLSAIRPESLSKRLESGDNHIGEGEEEQED